MEKKMQSKQCSICNRRHPSSHKNTVLSLKMLNGNQHGFFLCHLFFTPFLQDFFYFYFFGRFFRRKLTRPTALSEKIF